MTQPARDKSIETSVVSMSAVVSDLSNEIASAIGSLTLIRDIKVSSNGATADKNSCRLVTAEHADDHRVTCARKRQPLGDHRQARKPRK